MTPFVTLQTVAGSALSRIQKVQPERFLPLKSSRRTVATAGVPAFVSSARTVSSQNGSRNAESINERLLVEKFTPIDLKDSVQESSTMASPGHGDRGTGNASGGRPAGSQSWTSLYRSLAARGA